MSEYLLFVLLFPVLYAEIHYRFNFFFSLLFKSEPEIVSDIPSRIKNKDLLPVLLIVKDAHRFPVTINNITVYNNQEDIFHQEINKTINIPFKEIILKLNTSSLLPGRNLLNIQIKYEIRGKKKKCYNDNYRSGSHDPLPVFIAKEDLPRIENCLYGDMHYHTNYTSDQVEFGASVKSTAILAKSLNIDFFAATDHSYDLDDKPDNYLIQDQTLQKWKDLQQEIMAYNKENSDILIIPGEELSLRNDSGKNNHCLIYNSKRFVPGSGDSGEKWFRTRSEFSLNELCSEIDEKALVFAAHPGEDPPFLQRLLLDRDSWSRQDCSHNRLDGLQVFNGESPEYIERNKQIWIDILLSGNRSIGIAGNDAHGNFARFRQISLPPFTMKEHYHHLFGKWRTGIYMGSSSFTLENCLAVIKEGNCFMTNGPALQFMAQDDPGWFPMGSNCSRIKCLRLEVKSTNEFSAIEKTRIFYGIIGNSKESIIFEKNPEKKCYYFEQEFEPSVQHDAGYFRAEVYTESGYQALSNPIWF